MPQNAPAALAEALGRKGPGGRPALPYSEDFRRLLEQHMIELVQEIPSLHVKTREYTHIDGRTVELLLAEGTVPMWYQGVKYNIPVAVWLPERYPLAAPLVYVVPTPDMVIKPRHSFVDASGIVNTLYIGQWQYPASNLRDMAQDMSIHFGGDPPLFSKPPNWQAQQAQQAQQQPPRPPPAQPPPAAQPPARPPPYGYAVVDGSSSGGGLGAHGSGDDLHVHNPLAGGSFSSAGSGSRPRPPPPPPAPIPGGFDSVWEAMMAASSSSVAAQPPQQAAAPQQAVQQQQAQQQPPPKENPTAKLSAAFRSAAAASLHKRLHASLSALAAQAAAEAEEQLRLQASLRQRGEQLQHEVAALQAERVAVDKLSQDLASSNLQLDRWLAENEHLAKAADDPSSLDPDAVIAAADPLSQQALEVQAQDLALEDVLYALDKALGSAAIEPDAYLKQVRAVCRRQFFVRTVGSKVAAQQESARRAAPPPPPPHAHAVQRTLSTGRPVVLPQGDSWASAGVVPQQQPAGAPSSSGSGPALWGFAS